MEGRISSCPKPVRAFARSLFASVFSPNFFFLLVTTERSEVDHDEERRHPRHHDKLREAVVQHHLGGVAALLVHHGNLDVAQQTEDDIAAGEIQILRAEAGDDIGRHGIHDVAH